MNGLFARALLAFLVLPGVVAFLVPLLLFEPGVLAFSNTWGVAPLGIGIVLLIACVREFYITGRGTLAPWAPPATLVSTGLYKWSRNPMYVAVFLILLGWAIGFQSWPLALYAIVVLVAFHLRVVLHEEPRLARMFGDVWIQVPGAGGAMAVGLANIQMEPTRRPFHAIISPQRAAHLGVRHSRMTEENMARTSMGVDCGNCGCALDEAPGLPNANRQPCPSCGSRARHFRVGLHSALACHSDLGMKAKRQGVKKPIIKQKVGDSLHRKSGKWFNRVRVIDREQNQYFERVTDPIDGKVIHHCAEPLSEHRGHGSAKQSTKKPADSDA